MVALILMVEVLRKREIYGCQARSVRLVRQSDQ